MKKRINYLSRDPPFKFINHNYPLYKTTIKNITDKRIPIKSGVKLAIYLFSLKTLLNIKMRKQIKYKTLSFKEDKSSK